MSGGERTRSREELLDEGRTTLDMLHRLEELGAHEHTAALYRRLEELRAAYAAGLAEVPVSRCPFTGEAVAFPIDTVDLDGWWWDAEQPARRMPGHLPRPWLAMGGAMRLAPAVRWAPFVARPGPEVPYVVPRLLEGTDVVAVVSQVPVGPHTGFAVNYFGRAPEGRRLVGLWGSSSYPVRVSGGWRWDDVPAWTPDYDFALRPWLEEGRLYWIAPGDESLTLHSGADGCPYVDLQGEHEGAIVDEGEVTYPPPPPEEARELRLR